MNRFCLPLLLLSLAWPAPSQAGGLSEIQAQAAYIFNFIKFVEWPPGAVGGKVTLCVVGDEPLGKVLGALDGRVAGERELRVFQHDDGDDLNGCHVVFIRDSLQLRYLSLINSVGEAPVLTISAIEGFAERGGGIGLIYQDGKMLFEVNVAALNKGRLRLPAQVLNLAATVYGSGR